MQIALRSVGRILCSVALLLVVFLCSNQLNACMVVDDDPSIVLAVPARPNVENGKAYDFASFKLAKGHEVLVVPESARLERTKPGDEIEIFIEKELEFGGHVKAFVSIRDTRKRMGCAVKSVENKTILATYGEYLGTESSKTMELVIRVPNNVQVSTDKGLSGPIKRRRRPEEQKNREEINPGQNGWVELQDKPDANRIAAKKTPK